MYIDKQLVMSDDQAVTVTAASTNVIDTGSKSSLIQTIVGKGKGEVYIKIGTTFLTCTSLKITLQSSDAEAFGSGVSTHAEETILVAAALAGKELYWKLPDSLLRYVRVYYTVAGSDATAGKVDAAIILDRQTNGI